MTSTPAPASSPPAPRFVFDDGAAYEQMMGRWSALVAKPFLDWLAQPPGLAVLVGQPVCCDLARDGVAQPHDYSHFRRLNQRSMPPATRKQTTQNAG